jgi:hypothetical protein
VTSDQKLRGREIGPRNLESSNLENIAKERQAMFLIAKFSLSDMSLIESRGAHSMGVDIRGFTAFPVRVGTRSLLVGLKLFCDNPHYLWICD